MPNFREIARRFTQIIPSPRRKAVKEQASWATLKAGQRLQLQQGTIYTAEVGSCGAGTIFEVTEVDSDGAILQVTVAPSIKANLGGTLRWRDRDWAKTFEKVKRGPGRRAE